MYELLLAFVLTSADGARVMTVEAHEQLLRFFGLFGLTADGALFLGGAVIIAVLLVCMSLSGLRGDCSRKSAA